MLVTHIHTQHIISGLNMFTPFPTFFFNHLTLERRKNLMFFYTV